MTYKIEVPVPNDILNDRALSAYIESISKYKDHIECLYLPLGHVDVDIEVWGIRAPTFVYAGHELNLKAIHRWEWCIDQIMTYVDLPIKILMNNMYSRSFHDPDHRALIQKKLSYYAGKYMVNSVTIADYSALPLIYEVGLPVSLSTNSHNSFAELDMALELYGPQSFESIVIQRDLNRNPSKLNSYLTKRGLHDKSVLMVNEGCINGCPYKISGDIEIGISDVKTKQNVIHSGGCTILQVGHRWTFLTSPFLTKSMLDKYYPNIHRVKIAGRDLPVSNIKHQLQHWATGEDILLEKILNVFPKDTGIMVSDLDDQFLQDVMGCNKECFTCRKCENTFARLTGIPNLNVANSGLVEGFNVVDAEKLVQLVENATSGAT